MSLKKGSKIERGYATVDDEDGINYREIADIMSTIGHPMNHSSVRNYLLSGMKKFVLGINTKMKLNIQSKTVYDIAKSPSFQEGIAMILSEIEETKKDKRDHDKRQSEKRTKA